jgi:hypothetical protein
LDDKIAVEEESDVSQDINVEKLNDSGTDLELSTTHIKASKGMRDIQFISMFRSDDEESFDTSHIKIPENLVSGI